MSMTLEILRFNWKPNLIRLLLAASVHPGPVVANVWARRSGVPRNHLLPALREAERLGALAVEPGPEGLRLVVQRVEMWRERPECSAEEFAAAWGRAVEQLRLQLPTEMPGLGDALAEAAREHRNPVGQPESGDGDRNPVAPVLTYKRKDVSGLERNTSKRMEPESGDGLRERVRVFVGERDWRKYWEHEEAQALFDDPLRSKVLAGSLRYLQAGIAEGVKIRTNNGRALWSDFKRSMGKVAAKACTTATTRR